MTQSELSIKNQELNDTITDIMIMDYVIMKKTYSVKLVVKLKPQTPAKIQSVD